MAEKMMLVCDACGKPATETVTIKVDRGNFVKDLCGTHVNELVAGARKPRPGRRRAIVGASGASAPVARKSGARKSPARKTAVRKSAARKPGAKKRGRPRKTVEA